MISRLSFALSFSVRIDICSKPFGRFATRAPLRKASTGRWFAAAKAAAFSMTSSSVRSPKGLASLALVLELRWTLLDPLGPKASPISFLGCPWLEASSVEVRGIPVGFSLDAPSTCWVTGLPSVIAAVRGYLDFCLYPCPAEACVTLFRLDMADNKGLLIK